MSPQVLEVFEGVGLVGFVGLAWRFMLLWFKVRKELAEIRLQESKQRHEQKSEEFSTIQNESHKMRTELRERIGQLEKRVTELEHALHVSSQDNSRLRFENETLRQAKNTRPRAKKSNDSPTYPAAGH